MFCVSYGIETEDHENEKCCFNRSTKLVSIKTFRATYLDMLTVRPETVPKSLSSWFTMGVDVSGEVIKRSRSSAKGAHLCSCSPHKTPLMSGWVLIAEANVSIAIAEIKGDNGHPCLVPFLMLKVSKYLPIRRTCALGAK